MKPILYQFWRSSTSWRVRWALMVKGVDFDIETVDLAAGEQNAPKHVARNPMARIPVLCLDGRWLAESVAILEYLEETYPEPALYPTDRWARARVRQLVEYVNSGIQPMACPAVLTRARETQPERDAWGHYFNQRGMVAYEQMLAAIAAEQGRTGRFCVGDQFTAADICMVTQVWSARRFGVDLTGMPRILAVEQAALAMPHAERARPENQPGAPARG